MSLEKSQKVVKVLGILSVISAVLGLIAAIGMFGLTGLGAASIDTAAIDDQTAAGLASLGMVGIILLVSAIVELLQGIFSLRAAKDASKAMPLWIISIISVAFGVLSLINSFGKGTQEIFSAIFGLAISCGVFYLANNIKKAA